MVWMDWHCIECIFQIHTGHPAIRHYNIQNTLKGLHLKVFIFNVFTELFQVKNHSARVIPFLSGKYRWLKSPSSLMQGYITSLCNSFWILFDMICFSALVIGIFWQMLCAGSSAKHSFKSLLKMSMTKGSEVIDFHWERWLWMLPAVKHSSFCNKS